MILKDHEEDMQGFLIASGFIAKAAMIAIAQNVEGDKFIEFCADLFWDIEKDPKAFINVANIAELADIIPSLNADELKNHLIKLEVKCASIRQALEQYE